MRAINTVQMVSASEGSSEAWPVSASVVDYRQLTVVIPTLNEAGNIGELLDYLVHRYAGINLLVADDGSTDGTREEVMGRAHFNPCIGMLWRRGKTKGLTASVLDALSRVSTEYFAVMDGDLQHPPETLESMFLALNHGYPLSVATRRRFKVPPHRWMISKIATLMGRLRLWWTRSAHCTDCMSGYFAGRTNLFHQLMRNQRHRFEAEGYKVLFDFLKLLPGGTPVAEVGYEFDPRQRGQSKISTRIILVYLRSIFH